MGKIVRGDPMREFDGYASNEATKKKIGYDVFRKGDSYFLTGQWRWFSHLCYCSVSRFYSPKSV